jgi:hypothetical protein
MPLASQTSRNFPIVGKRGKREIHRKEGTIAVYQKLPRIFAHRFWWRISTNTRGSGIKRSARFRFTRSVRFFFEPKNEA